jgi:hypothetical protein
LKGKGWFPLELAPLHGRGHAAVAYRIHWAGKVVLFSGQIPIKMNQQAVEDLLRALAEPEGSASEYLRSLDRLEGLKPDLWLPLIPMNEQNASLYGREWADTIDYNRTVTGIGR